MNKKLGFSLIELSIVILVIGILVIGVTSGSRLVSKSKIESARSLTKSSPVNFIEGLFLWVETTSEESLDDSEESDSSTVTNLYDINRQSTVKNNFSQSTTDEKPVYLADGINGLPVLSFDGSDDVLKTDNISPSRFFVEKPDGKQNTVFMVFKNLSGTVVLSFSPINNINSKYTIEASGTIKAIYPSDIDSGSTNVLSKPTMVTLMRGPNDQKRGYVNGSLEIDEATTASFSDKSATPIVIGGFNFDTIYNAEVYFGELIIFNRALKDSERLSVESYLKQKWGIS
jgi:prepilin-type N-terminal cleavage/methylation domain-containing protein